MRSASLRGPRTRLRWVQAGLVFAFVGLALRAAQLCLFDARAVERGAAQVLSLLRLPPARGSIVDREGVELALSTDAPSVYAIPRAIENPEQTVAALARVLGSKPTQLARQLRSQHSFVYVARWVDAERAERVRELRLPGVGIVQEPRRSYPYPLLASPVIGFANIDGLGVRGIEQQEDGWLRGNPQRVPVERDARGHLLVGPGLDPFEASGGDVALSIDIAFQADAERLLQEAMEEAHARGGFVVCLEPHSGKVLALAERPSFDANRFRSVSYTETRSRAFLDALEPGSTLKLFLVAAALEAGVVTPEEVIDLDGGKVRVPGKWIRDLHPRPSLDVSGILRVSSNVGAVKIAQRLGPETHFQMLRRFGFGSRTGSGFPEESAGVLRSWRAWKPIDHATIAFGQGINVTAIQLAAAAAVFANAGVWKPPRLIVARRPPGGRWEATPPEHGGERRVVSAETASAVLAMMEEVVSARGTGRRAALRGVRVAGKTGTAQKLDARTGTYSTDRYVAWFIGIAPAEAPRIVEIVALDEPRGARHTGGGVAAPLFARVAAAHLTRLGLPTRPQAIPRPSPKPPRPALARPRHAAAPSHSTSGVARFGRRTLLPDFRGLSIDEVRRMTAGTPIVLEPSGAGFAVEQTPEAGTVVLGDAQRVRVRFVPAETEG